MLKDLGVDTYRFSVEWAKIEPVEGQYDAKAITHYRKEIDRLKRAGIAPMITLQHFTMPRWLREKGGWEWVGSEGAFTKFAALVYSKIAPGVRDWITINEPMVNVMGGYYEGVVPPGEHRGLDGVVPVVRGLLKAHASAYMVLHDLAKFRGAEVRVGMAHHLRTFDPAGLINPLDMVASALAQQAWNWMIPDALETGRLQMHLLWFVDDDEYIPGLAGSQDFVGVNYYTGDLISFSSSKGIIQQARDWLPKTDLGWDIYPDGFYRVLREVGDRYPGKPVFVTENGIADATDSERPEFSAVICVLCLKRSRRGFPSKAIAIGRSWTTSSGSRASLLGSDSTRWITKPSNGRLARALSCSRRSFAITASKSKTYTPLRLSAQNCKLGRSRQTNNAAQ